MAYDFDVAEEVCLGGQTGYLVRSGDVGMAAKKLSLLARNPELRGKFGRNGAAFVKENFSVKKMVADQYQLYQHLWSRIIANASPRLPN